MRKTLFLILFAVLAIGAVFGQGSESFANSNATSTYAAASFVGDTGVTWSYTQSRDQDVYPITGNGLMLRRASDSSLSATLTGGLGTFTFQYRKAFTGTAVRQLEFYVNDVVVATTSEFGTITGEETTVYTMTIENVNVTGNVIVKIKNVGTTTTNRQTTIDNISWTGYTGGSTPIINAPASIPAFSTTTGNPSDIQSYTLSGSNLTSDIIVSIPAGYEISTDQSTWLSGLSVASAFNGLVYVRLTGTTAGTYDGNIVHSSTGAANVNTAVTGLVSDPTPVILPVGTLSAFNTIVGTPSAAQQYALTGAFLTTNIVVAAPAGFELSTDGTTYTTGLSLIPTFNGQIHVRLIGTTVGPYSGNITHNSTGAPEATVDVSGTVNNPTGPTTFIEENFNYTSGTLLTASGWTAHNGAGTNSISVSEPNLTYPSYPPSNGLSVTLVNTGEDVNKAFTGQITGNIYSSFLINVSNATTTGDYVLHFNQETFSTSFQRGRLFIQKDTASDNYRLGLSNAGAVGTAVWTGYDYSYNTTNLIVMKYEIVSGANNDLIHLWVNPTVGAAETATTFVSTDAITTEPANIGSLALRQGGSTSGPTLKIDGIRVTNSWALLWDGTPPPPPEITVAGELTPFTSTVNTPSAEIQSYTLTGSNLTASLVAQAPSGFQLSTTGTDGWTDMLTLASNYNGLIYVRMFTTAANTYEGDIHHTSTGADPVDLHVSGESFNPAVIWNITQNLQQFSQEAGTPSENQSYTLSATNATANIGITVEAPFELSTTGTSNWLTTLDLAPEFNGTIYVRMNSATAGPFSSTIVHSTADASNYDIAVSGTATAPPGIYATDLFFSEYIEGSSNNKALEIFNGTGAPVDLSNYKVVLYSNGSATPGNTLTFTAGTMLAHGDVYVIVNASANPAIQAQADVQSTVTYFNGDDAVALEKVEPAAMVDIFGMIGQDPDGSTATGSWTADGGYSTINKTLVRKPTITQGVSVNPTGYVSGDPAAFETLATEWDVYPQDTTTYLGSHTFTPGMQVAVAPVMNPAGGIYSSTINVSLSTTTPSATIYYTIDGDTPSNTNGTVYTTAIPVSATTTLKAIAYATGFTASSVTTENYLFPTLVANIAALRASATGSTVYRLTGEAILTFQQNTTRHPKYIQDASAAIVIDDPSAIITSVYNLYDGITGITGTLGLYNGLLQFTPVADPGAATSSGNVIVPEVRTLASLTPADQAKLIKVMNATIDPTSVNFPGSTGNVNVTDASGTRILRTFASTDYNDTPIPTVTTDIVCLVGQFNLDMQISPRFLSDMTPSATGSLDTPVVTISRSGTNVTLNWNAIAGANSGYRIEMDTNPYGSFSEIYNVLPGVLTWSQASAEKKFYRVIALP